MHDELHKMIQCSLLGWPGGENSKALQLLDKLVSALRREVEDANKSNAMMRERCEASLIEAERATSRLTTAETALSQLQDINNPMHFGLHPPKAMLDSHEIATNALAALAAGERWANSEGPSFEELKPEDQDKIRRQQQ